MKTLRDHIALVGVCFAGVLFYAALHLQVNYDILSLVAVAFTFAMALKDVRFLLIGWFLFAPYFAGLGDEGAVNIASNASHNLIVPLITAIILGTKFVREKRLVFGWEDVVLLAFLAYGLISFLFIAKGGYEEIRRMYFIYFLPYLLFATFRNIDIDATFLKSLAFAGVFHLVVLFITGIIEFQTGVSLYTKVLQWGDVAYGRIAGPFRTPIILGLFVSIVFLLIYAAYRFELVPRLVLLPSAVVSTVIILLTFTRSVWLGAVVGLLYLMYRTTVDVSSRVFRVIGLSGAAALVVLTAALSSPEVAKRIYDEENPSFRVVMADASVRMFLDRPVVGWGIGTFDEVSERYLLDMLGIYIAQDTSHVTLLTIMAELGLIGTILFCLFIYRSMRRKGMPLEEMSEDGQLFVHVNIACILVFAVNAFLIDMRFYTLAYSWFFMNLGMIQNMYRIDT